MSYISPKVLLFALALPLWCQTESAQIAGLITDEAGKPVASAEIRVFSEKTNYTQVSAASKSGYYSIAALGPDVYSIRVSAPGFTPLSRRIDAVAGSRMRADFQLNAQGAPPRNPVSFSDLQTQQQSIGQKELRDLPNLTRNVFAFAELSGNVSEAGLGTRGVGLAVNGQRESSSNLLLDGIVNNNYFAGALGQPVPLEAVQELSLITSGFSAEYGAAAGGIVNIASKSGSNKLHGTTYEFNRVSALTSNSYKDNANGAKETGFTRNQFGYSVGGSILRNQLFFFSAGEGTLVRSNATINAWVPSSQLIAQTSQNTRAFFQALGQIRPDAHLLGTMSLNDLAALYGRNPCTGLACSTLVGELPLLNHVAYKVPGGSGGGVPQNTGNTLNRLDYVLSDSTRLYARYSFYRENNPSGALSSSPYSNYDLGQDQTDNTFAVGLTHTWSSTWTSQTKLAFSRLAITQQGLTSRGVVPSMYANPLAPLSIGTDYIALPGYNPFSPGSGGAFGGPQNVLELSHETSWTKGKHSIRYGGSYIYLRDNRTDAAYQTAVDSLSNGGGLGPSLNGLLLGRFAQIQVAVNPQGKFPCAAGLTSANCLLTQPVTSPNFSRSNRSSDGSLYAQDSWRLSRGLTLNLGIRWEHFGVQHNANPKLDSNWFAPNVAFADSNLGAYLRNGGLQVANQSPVGGLWKPDWRDFAPRIGFAWDVFGNGATIVRGGYGIGYERNFGNVTFNVIQNLPNYAVLDSPGPITANNFGPFGNAGSASLPQVGARIIDPNIKTAYAHLWNASIQRIILPGISYAAEYSGSKGVDLYSVSYPNQAGFGNFALGDPCTGAGDCTSQPNSNYGEDVGYRGNQGFSIYHSLNNRVSVDNLLGLGIRLVANYTWAHAIDNLSSTFFEAGGQGVASLFGNQNITVNNGDFVAGLLDPYHPNLDRGNADFDVRHRVTLFGEWETSGWRQLPRLRSALAGWSFNPIFTARSGQPFSVFDTTSQTLDLSAPRAAFNGRVPSKRNTYTAAATPDTFQIIRFLAPQIASVPNPLTPGGKWPSNLSGRNAFQAPGFWNFDLGVHKEIRLTDRFLLQLRGESFNLFNHANLYVIGASADVGRSNTVNACYGCTGSTYDRRQVQLAAKLIF